jgi:hypothetical protein
MMIEWKTGACPLRVAADLGDGTKLLQCGHHYIRSREWGAAFDAERAHAFDRWAAAEHQDVTAEQCAAIVGCDVARLMEAAT